MLRAARKVLKISFCLFVLSCSQPNREFAGWVPVKTTGQRPAGNPDDVLVVDGVVPAGSAKIGYMRPPEGRIVNVSMLDNELLDFFKSHAAKMGANVVHLKTPDVIYKSGTVPGTTVSFFHLDDNEGTHGGDDVESEIGTQNYHNELKIF